MSAIGGPNIGSDTWDCQNPQMVKLRLTTSLDYTKQIYQIAYEHLQKAIEQNNEDEIRAANTKLWIVADGLRPEDRLNSDEAGALWKIRIEAAHALSHFAIQSQQRLARGLSSQSSRPAGAP